MRLKTLKKSLLAGTTVLALGGFVAPAMAQSVTLTGNTTLGAGDLAAPTAGVDVELDGYDLTINNTDNTELGDITDTNMTPDGNILVETSAASDITQTIGSVDNGTGNFTIQNATHDADISVTITNGLDVGGNLVLNADADGTDATADAITLTVGGNAVVTGTTDIDANDNAAAAETLLVLNGDANVFTGAVTVTGGDNNADSTAGIAITGASTTFTNGLDLNAGIAADAELVLDSDSAQTIIGDITGDGVVRVENAAGVTFDGTVAAETVTIEDAAAANSAATFTNTVNLGTGLTLGGAGTGTNTVTFDTTDNDFTVTGTVDGAIDGETNNVVASGGGTLTQASIWGGVAGEIDSFSITGSTTVDSDAAITADAISVGEGSTLDAAAALTTTDGLDNDGTLIFSTGATHGTDITGDGTLDVDATSTVNGSITQDNVDIAAVTLNQGAVGYTVDTTNFSNTGTLALVAGDQTLSGDFTNTTAGQGTITIADGAGTTTFSGDLGEASDDELAALTTADAGTAQTIVASGNLYVAAIELNTDDTLNLTGSGVTVSGTIDAETAGEGIVNVQDGASVTFGSAVGTTNLGAFSVDSGATATFTNNVLVQSATGGALNFDGTVNVNTTEGAVLFDNTSTGAIGIDGTLNVFGDDTAAFTFGAGANSELHFGWNDTSSVLNAGGDIVFGDDAVIGGGMVVEGDVYTINAVFRDGDGMADAGYNPLTDGPVIDAGGNLVQVATGATLRVGLTGLDSEVSDNLTTSDQSITFITNASMASDLDGEVDDGDIVFVDTAFLDLSNDSATTSDTVLAANVKLKSTSDALGGQTEFAGAANAAIATSGAGGTLADGRNNLLLASNTQTANATAESLSADANAAAATTAFEVSNVGGDFIDTRLSGSAGVSSGNVMEGLQMWGQVFGRQSDQSDRDGVTGYEADTTGFTIGFDTESMNVFNHSKIGIAFTYADTEVDGDANAIGSRNNSDIDTYQIALYGSYDISDDTFLDTQISYGWGDVEGQRTNVGGTGAIANSDYDTEQFGARAKLGRVMVMDNGWTVTPNVNATYVHFDADTYTETGAGTANLTVDNDSLQMFEVGAGVKTSYTYSMDNGSYFQPRFRAGVAYDFIGDEVESTNTFQGGGAAFETQGANPAQFRGILGAGATYYANSNVELSADYQYDVQEDYDAHTGLLKASFKF